MTPSLMVPCVLVVVAAVSMTGCQPGRLTDDRRYVGSPERPEATSEATRDTDTGNQTPADRE